MPLPDYPILTLIVLGITAIAGAFVGAVTGGGVTAILLPVLVLYTNVQDAVPIVTLSLVTATVSRVWFYRRQLVLPVVGWMSLGSLPATLLGTWLFTRAPAGPLTRLLGAMLLASVIWRWARPHPPQRFGAAWFLPVGAAFGFLNGISAAVGSMLAPFFLAYGLRKGHFVGTLGLCVFLIQVAKLAVFGGTSFLHGPQVAMGLALVPCMVLGTWLGERLVTRMSERVFERIVEAVMVGAGLWFLIRGEG